MIPDQWYPLIESDRVRRKPLALRRLGESLVLWRDAAGALACMRDRCPHRGVALSRGRVRGNELECGYHGFRFERGGACVAIPCDGPNARIPRRMRATTWPVREAYGLVWAFWGEARDALPEIPWFDALGDRRAGTCSGTLDWPLNYVRTIESNFDLHHTPWLHRSIAPVGAIVEPYEVEIDGTDIRTRGELRREGHTKGMPFRLDFKFPSITYLGLTDKLYAVVADCPIDDATTWRFIRYYQDYVRVPGLAWLVSWLALQVEIRVAQNRQDLPMVRTQRPREPGAHEDVLVRADRGTAAYLKLRRQLLDAAAKERGRAAALRTA